MLQGRRTHYLEGELQEFCRGARRQERNRDANI